MEKTLIIGNGFDLNLGFKTSYNDFLSSQNFEKLIDSGNHLAYFLQQLNEFNNTSTQEQKWVDIEHELKSYSFLLKNSKKITDETTSSNNLVANPYKNKIDEFENKEAIIYFITLGLYNEIKTRLTIHDSITHEKVMDECARLRSTLLASMRDTNIGLAISENKAHLAEQYERHLSNFKSEFVSLKETLSLYLQTETKDKNYSEKTNAFNLLKLGKLFDNNDKQYCISFTPKENVSTFTQIFTFNYTDSVGLTGFKTSVGKNVDIFFMHGSLHQKNIVFGVEDGSVDEEFLFLTKSGHAAFGESPDIAKAMIAADEIHFFGCSLGDTDNAHFQHPFTELSQRRNKENATKIIFYVFGKDGYESILKRILFLTDGRMSEFKITNDVVFFDLKENTVINQGWLNK